ncbi:UvrD/REP helicase [Desulfofarcimen acetoxidans DSM 771]|uniref:DNA 3'-5' helicase n=1 Tax=Desulfofarcimen acetoxidans (strain ATCC 49208 / DSM 771 / KCTC 5769 / VKM B-1644 / 5575) TaxID=485916 RepID=C8VW57_DESAS|nr:UvrD-helicase domain-containing protein [Desulfofarcimen acetoxidans]ACV62409.1 UvrD/REP helicase [Desulfofarcimen acetoxidans DSM 771]
MLLTEIPQAVNNMMEFFLSAARAWQNYCDVKSLFTGIELTREQMALVLQYEEQMLINGSAGSGKSITLLYKLLKLMEQEHKRQRILYLSFSKTLIDDAKKRVKDSPIYDKVRDKHELHMLTFHGMAYRMLKEAGFVIKPYPSSIRNIKEHESTLLNRVNVMREQFMSSDEYGQLSSQERFFSTQNGTFLLEEFLWMKANGYVNKKDYLEVERTGRSHNPRLTKAQRNTIYIVFEEYCRWMEERFHRDLDMEDYALLLLKNREHIPRTMYYDYIFVDEVQDLQPMQIKALVQYTNKSIVLSGDPKQRIYKRTPHTYANLGLQLQGRRNRTLTKNFRSTKQIMTLANAINFDDVQNDRLDAVDFVKEGDRPEIRFYSSDNEMHRYLVQEIKNRLSEDPGCSIAVIHRYEEELHRRVAPPVQSALARSFDLITTERYSARFNYKSAKKPVFFTDAYSVKGLEFDYVFILQFDSFHYPNKKKIEDLNKLAENKKSEIYERDYNTILNDEKKVLYVAITRARKKVVLLWVAENELKVSPFIRNFSCEDYEAYGLNKNNLLVVLTRLEGK